MNLVLMYRSGGEASYDVSKAAVTKYSTSVGYLSPEYSTAITATNNLSVFNASFFQKVSSAVQAGAKASYDTKSAGTVGLELAGRYQIEPLSFVKVREPARMPHVRTESTNDVNDRVR